MRPEMKRKPVRPNNDLTDSIASKAWHAPAVIVTLGCWGGHGMPV